jgi:alpha-glucosidase (family GH31 glycosyl hydrolase)
VPALQGEGIKSEPYRLFNLDVFEYLHDSPFGLYGSIPFLMAHGPRGATGLFWLNAAEMYVDVSLAATTEHPQTSWIAETGMLDVFIMTGTRTAYPRRWSVDSPCSATTDRILEQLFDDSSFALVVHHHHRIHPHCTHRPGWC